MTNVSEWSVVAGNNNSSPPDGWPEGMQRSAVNDTAREGMAAHAKWYQDARGSLTTAGGTTAYTLTTNNVFTALSDVPLMAIRANVANTGAVTLAIDGLTAKSLTKNNGVALSAGDFTTNKLYLLAYNTSADRIEILNAMTADVGVPSGTAQVFVQTAAPTAWTKSVTHDNKALRVVTGTASSGGTTAFTSVFASRTLTQANLPSFNLSLASLTGSVGTSITNGTNVARNPNTNNNSQSGGGSNIVNSVTESTISLASGIVTFGGTLPSGGAGTAVDFAVQYVDVIIATKD